MPVDNVKPFGQWSAAELMRKLDEIFQAIAAEDLTTLVAPFTKALEAAKLQLATAEAELASFSLTGNVDAAQLAALTEIFQHSGRAAVAAAKDKVSVAQRALDYVMKQTTNQVT